MAPDTGDGAHLAVGATRGLVLAPVGFRQGRGPSGTRPMGLVFLAAGVTVEPHQVNGQPGAIFRDHERKVLSTLTLDILDGRIRMPRSPINPSKLGHLGPVADPWAVIGEASQARRAPSD